MISVVKMCLRNLSILIHEYVKYIRKATIIGLEQQLGLIFQKSYQFCMLFNSLFLSSEIYVWKLAQTWAQQSFHHLYCFDCNMSHQNAKHQQMRQLCVESKWSCKSKMLLIYTVIYAIYSILHMLNVICARCFRIGMPLDRLATTWFYYVKITKTQRPQQQQQHTMWTNSMKSLR